MNKIITLTVNPAVDKSTTVASIKPNSKLRCSDPVFEAGGGGINVSRVLAELGGTSLCMYLAGGPTGKHLKDLVDAQQIPQDIIPIEGWTRENLAVTDTSAHQQYRFGMPGPKVNELEWKKTLEHLHDALQEGDILIASGSLCPGMPVDFFGQVAKISLKKNVKFILDTSGEALRSAVKVGVFLLKPNLGELSSLCGVTSISFKELEGYAKKFVVDNPCEVIVISLGAKGALMATKDTLEYIAAPIVHQKSTIGAGDSMVAGMVYRLSQGKSLREMVRYGVACGTAATMTEGTQLCKKKDVTSLFKWIKKNTGKSAKKIINA
jgi:6-phosphofructokinase 2